MTYAAKHARILAGASGLQCRVWMHYAATGDDRSRRCTDGWLATLLECTRPKLFEARTWLVEQDLLFPVGNTYRVQEWTR